MIKSFFGHFLDDESIGPSRVWRRLLPLFPYRTRNRLHLYDLTKSDYRSAAPTIDISIAPLAVKDRHASIFISRPWMSCPCLRRARSTPTGCIPVLLQPYYACNSAMLSYSPGRLPPARAVLWGPLILIGAWSATTNPMGLAEVRIMHAHTCLWKGRGC